MSWKTCDQIDCEGLNYRFADGGNKCISGEGADSCSLFI